MTATDFFHARRDAGTGLGPKRETLHTFSGTNVNSVFFLFRSVLGMMFFLGAIGMWVLPGALLVPELRMMQITVTGLFLALGFVLFRGSPPSQRPELHIDMVRRTVELGVRDLTGGTVSIARYQLDELSDIAVLSTTVVATDLSGNRVITLDLESRTAATELRDFLSDMPPLSNPSNVFRDHNSIF